MSEAFIVRRAGTATTPRGLRLPASEVVSPTPVALHPLDPRVPLEARLAFVTIGRMLVSAVGVGAGAAMHLASAETYRVVLPIDGAASARMPNGSVHGLDRSAGLVVGPGDAVTVATRQRFAQLTLSFPVALVQAEMEAVLGAAVGAVRFAVRVDLTTPAGREWLDAGALIEATPGSTTLSGSPLSAGLDRRLVALLVRAQPSQISPRLRRPFPNVVERAIEAIDARPAYRWSIGDLAAAVPCGVRTLQSGFQKALGVTPTEHLRQVRLQRVHDELEIAVPGSATVTDVAMSWGFSHMGRFSAAYHTAFEEYPHQTLQGPDRDH